MKIISVKTITKRETLSFVVPIRLNTSSVLFIVRNLFKSVEEKGTSEAVKDSTEISCLKLS